VSVNTALTIGVSLGGMLLNWDRGHVVVLTEDLDGWYDTPEPESRDAERVLSDGGVWGPKTIRPREVTLSGSASATHRRDLIAIRDQLAFRATVRQPIELVVSDRVLGESLSASVRGVSGLTWRPIGPNAARWSLTVRAADPRRYETYWQSFVIQHGEGEGANTGRFYPRLFPWHYTSPIPPGSARLVNRGNAPAPVYCTYAGPLSESRLRHSNTNSIIRVAELQPGEVITIESTTLTAYALGGASRARFILPGSVPMAVEPASTVTWQLSSLGSGRVTLEWRSAWS
jgi:hypothetical protein